LIYTIGEKPKIKINMQNFTIVADACTRQLRPTDLSLITAGRRGKTTLELIDNPEYDYKLNYLVNVEGRQLGLLRLYHVKAVIDKGLMSFRYDNTSLYRDHIADMKQFLSDYQIEPANITSLELAVDTNKDLISEFLFYFNNPEHYHYHLSPMTADKVRVAGDMWRNGETNLTYYQHISGDKSLKIYNKTADIAEKSKYYISDYHEANGLDRKKEVFRCELTLLNSAFKSKVTDYRRGNEVLSFHHYKQLAESEKRGFKENVTVLDSTPTIQDMRNPSVLLSLFSEYTNKLNIFSKKDNQRKSRCTPIQLLELPDVETLVPIEYIQDNKKYKIQMSTTFKTLIRNFYTTGNATYMRTAELLAKDTNSAAELEKQMKTLAHLRPLYTAPVKPSTGFSI
jgi:hypothetical protein